MKKWAVLVMVVVLAVGGGAAWALANRVGDEPPRVMTLAERLAELGDNPSPESDIMLDRCFEKLPVLEESGAMNPELAAFPSRLLGPEFELTSVSFGELCGLQAPKRMLETAWRHRDSGVELLLDQSVGSESPLRIAELFATFTDAGYDYYLLNTSLLSAPQGRPNGATAHRVLELAVGQLKPPVPPSCFYRSATRDWADLSALGIGDPRPNLPEGYNVVRLDFTALERPAAGCPLTAAPLPGEPEVQLQAMFSGPGTSLLAIFARAITPGESPVAATFQRGGATWRSEKYQFSINWAPEYVSEDQARAIATALDPGFGAVCSLTSTSVDFSELREPSLRQLTLPPNASDISGMFQLIGPAQTCRDSGQPGFMAKWMIEYKDRGALIDVTAWRGPQIPNTQPFYFEDRTLYWKHTDGTEFSISGLKAEFARADLLAIAHSLDATFNESMITTPDVP